jgi:probable phosphoglycerate mutase
MENQVNVNIQIKFDGSCYPNPGGRMGAGAIIQVLDSEPSIEHTVSVSIASSIGNTNNVAEYMALGYALLIVSRMYPVVDNLLIIGDSALVINQMSGTWKLKQGSYIDEALRTRAMLSQVRFSSVEFRWVPRDQNKEADILSR